MTSPRGCLAAAVSGMSAAIAASWAKYMGSRELLDYIEAEYKWLDRAAVTVMGFGVYVAINLIMWIVFVKALRLNDNCVAALAVNHVANFVFSVSLLGHDTTTASSSGDTWCVAIRGTADSRLVRGRGSDLWGRSLPIIVKQLSI